MTEPVGMTLHAEIAQAPEVVGRLLRSGRAPLDELATAVDRRSISAVILAARGSSDHAATYAQYALGIRNQLAVGLATPSVQSLYGAHPDVRRALVIGMSQSGQSPDVVEVIADAHRQGALTLAITNDPASPLAAAAAIVLTLGAGRESAVAATKTYVAELVAVAMLSDTLRPGARDSALEELPAALSRALETEPAVASVAQAEASITECAVIGRGYTYPAAREWALKLKEVARLSTDPYSAADFEHGPITLVAPGYRVLTIAVRGATLPGLQRLLESLHRLGASLLIATDDAATGRLGDSVLNLDLSVPEWLSPVSAAIPCQLFAYHLALAKGLDPEAPRHLQKVTRTH